MNSKEHVSNEAPSIEETLSSTPVASPSLATIRTPLVALFVLLSCGCIIFPFLLLNGKMLAQQVTHSINFQAMAAGWVGFFIIALALVTTAVRQTRLYRNQMQHLTNLINDVEQDNYTRSSKELENGPLSGLAHSLDAILESTISQRKEEEERVRSQEQFMGLLVEISSMRDGDLTARADVTEDSHGAVADSFNVLVENFSEVIEQTRSTCSQGLEAMREVSNECTTLIDSNLHQAKSITTALHVARSSLKANLKTLEESEASAPEKQPVVSQSLLASLQHNEKAARTSLKKTSQLLNETESTLKSFKKNLNGLQETTDFLNQLADKTSILALNASIQTTMAENSGSGFEEISEELNRLSGSSGEFSRKLKHLIDDHQTDLEDLINFTTQSIEASASNQLHVSTLQNDFQLISEKVQKEPDIAVQVAEPDSDQQKRLESLVDSLDEMANVCRHSVLIGTRTGESIDRLSSVMIDLQNGLSHYMVNGEETQTKMRSY